MSNRTILSIAVIFAVVVAGYVCTEQFVYAQYGPLAVGDLEITPAEDFEPNGPSGGPFTPSAKEYQLRNVGPNSLYWGVDVDMNWLDLDSDWGLLDPNQTALVTVSVNSLADTFAPGTYLGSVAFTDITNNDEQFRGVTLTVDDGTGSTLLVTPQDGFEPSGLPGGPFEPSLKTYTLKNVGPTAFYWGADIAAAWLDLDDTWGLLDPNQTTTVTVSLTSAADSLPEGVYNDTVFFTNLTTFEEQMRPATLTIAGPGGIWVDPPSFDFQVIEGLTAADILTIGNDGDSDLNYVIRTRNVAAADETAARIEKALATAQKASTTPPYYDYDAVTDANYKPGELIVRFAAKNGGKRMNKAEKDEVVSSIDDGASIKKSFKLLPDVSVVQLPPGLTVEEALSKFSKKAEILYAQPNYEVYALSTFPNDSHFNELWGMHNTGQTGGNEDADIDAPEAWDIATGSQEIIVAVIDTGVDYHHPDLAGNMWVNEAEYNGAPGIDDDFNGYVDDIYGYDFCNNDGNPIDDHYHGTHCAGTIGAIGNNAEGVAGVCWNVRIMAIKFLDSGGRGWTDDAIDSVEYSVLMGANLSSNSWGGGSYNQGLADAIEAAGAAGMLFVAAAGNSNSNNDVSPHYPSSYEHDSVIAVMSTDKYDNKSSFSCYGPTSVDVGAPGSDILSCQLGGGYKYLSGTSMATPHVAGACALLWSMNPQMTNLEIKDILLNTVDKTLPGKCVSEGRLNLYNAILETRAPWITVTPEEGTIPPGQSVDIDLAFDAGNMTVGQYEAEIIIMSNDPYAPVVAVPVVMTVIPDDLQVAPTEGFESSGTKGGPFEPRQMTYTLTNNGVEAVNWVTQPTQTWLEVTPYEGWLDPNDSIDVIARIGPDANLLDPNIYAETLVIQNLNSGSVKKRAIDLSVNPPDLFTEIFDAGDNDLEYMRLTFIPDGTIAYYTACREKANEFSTDPAGGTYISLADDDFVEVALADGKEVLFYGNWYDRLYIGSNGYITFGAGDVRYTTSLANHFSLPRVSGLFADLTPLNSQCISFRQLEDRIAVTYIDIPVFGEKDVTNSFQIEMFFVDGAISITWLNLGTVEGLAGLSDGVGASGVFLESDLSEYSWCCPLGDFDDNYSVNASDFAVLAARWLDEDCNIPYWCGRADLDFSGAVDPWDVGMFAANWLFTDSWWLAPKCHWKFDEGSGTIAYDSEGHYHGVLYGDTCWTTGVLDSALEFDGDADYVRTTYEGGPEEYTVSLWYNLNEDIDPSTFSELRALVSKTGDETATVNLWSVWFTPTNGLEFVNETGTSVYAKTSYIPPMFYKDQWHHVVVTGTPSEGRIYFDGELKNTASGNFAVGVWDDSVPFDIGRPYTGHTERFFNGKLDDIRIYDRVLSDEEIFGIFQKGQSRKAYGPSPTDGAADTDPATDLSWLPGYGAASHNVYFGLDFDDVNDANEFSPEFMGNQTQTTFDPNGLSKDTTYYWRIDEVAGASIVKGDVWSFTTWKDLVLDPVSWWKFDEAGGDIAYDSAGANDCVLTNGVGRTGSISGGGLGLDGIDDFAIAGTSPFDFADTTFTVSAWFRTMAGGTIIAEGGYQHGGWHVYVHSLEGQLNIQLKGLDPQGVNRDAYRCYTAQTYTDGLWHHVAAVVTTSTVSSGGNHAVIYIDGCPAETDEVKVYPYKASDEFVSLGARGNGTSAYFAGLLDEVIVFNRSLSAHEVEQLYQQSRRQAYSPDPADELPAVNPQTALSWLPGYGAISHDVYFGLDFDDVNDANESSPEFRGNQLETAFDPNGLDTNTTYYWRIDEQTLSGTVKGNVWSFTTWVPFVADPITWWKFDEGAGPTAYDSVGGYHGTLYGDPNWVAGQIQGALNFDGDEDCVRSTYEGGPIEYTVSLWYNLNEDIDPATSGALRALVSKTGDETYTVNLWSVWFAATNGLEFVNETATSVYAKTSYKPPMFYKDQWHHVVVTGTASEGRIYFDGELKNTASGNFAVGVWDDSVPFDIGRPYAGDSGRFFNGRIDSVMIFDRPLSDGEIEQLYLSGRTPN